MSDLIFWSKIFNLSSAECARRMEKVSVHSIFFMQVVWDFLDAKTGGEPITRNEGIFIRNPICEEDRKKYEVRRREAGNRVTFMLVVNCLEVVNTGRYKCLIQIPGIGPQNWPSKIGYLTVQGKFQLLAHKMPRKIVADYSHEISILIFYEK